MIDKIILNDRVNGNIHMYIETPNMQFGDETMHGFFVHLEYDVNNHNRELRFLLNCGEDSLIPQIVHLGNWTVTEAIDRAIGVSKININQFNIDLNESLLDDNVVEFMSSSLNPLISLILYLCADEPDIIDKEFKPGGIIKPQPKKTKKGWRWFPAKQVKQYKVGENLANELSKLRKHIKLSVKTGVTPHIRKAHWHGYWTGKKNEDNRKFYYKWLPPILVVGNKDIDTNNEHQN